MYVNIPPYCLSRVIHVLYSKCACAENDKIHCRTRSMETIAINCGMDKRKSLNQKNYFGINAVHGM